MSETALECVGSWSEEIGALQRRAVRVRGAPGLRSEALNELIWAAGEAVSVGARYMLWVRRVIGGAVNWVVGVSLGRSGSKGEGEVGGVDRLTRTG